LDRKRGKGGRSLDNENKPFFSSVFYSSSFLFLGLRLPLTHMDNNPFVDCTEVGRAASWERKKVTQVENCHINSDHDDDDNNTYLPTGTTEAEGASSSCSF